MLWVYRLSQGPASRRRGLNQSLHYLWLNYQASSKIQWWVAPSCFSDKRNLLNKSMHLFFQLFASLIANDSTACRGLWKLRFIPISFGGQGEGLTPAAKMSMDLTGQVHGTGGGRLEIPPHLALKLWFNKELSQFISWYTCCDITYRRSYCYNPL